jgi:hypothetical protein
MLPGRPRARSERRDGGTAERLWKLPTEPWTAAAPWGGHRDCVGCLVKPVATAWSLQMVEERRDPRAAPRNAESLWSLTSEVSRPGGTEGRLECLVGLRTFTKTRSGDGMNRIVAVFARQQGLWQACDACPAAHQRAPLRVAARGGRAARFVSSPWR